MTNKRAWSRILLGRPVASGPAGRRSRCRASLAGLAGEWGLGLACDLSTPRASLVWAGSLPLLTVMEQEEIISTF